ncbi:HEAT repeat domain-containing protein [Dactylosporangium sp. NPDC051541]|uniref:HEAT repeat domain-containing protein n=1 Tax=Dactylosporangium sp. NPDC051541 TaxID=3363977 RepID=UPI00379C4598
MSDLASSRPAPDEPPDPRPGGPTDVSGLFPSSKELFVPAARGPSDDPLGAESDLDELALSPLAEVIADLADLRAPDPAPTPDALDRSDRFAGFDHESRPAANEVGPLRNDIPHFAGSTGGSGGYANPNTDISGFVPNYGDLSGGNYTIPDARSAPDSDPQPASAPAQDHRQSTNAQVPAESWPTPEPRTPPNDRQPPPPWPAANGWTPADHWSPEGTWTAADDEAALGGSPNCDDPDLLFPPPPAAPQPDQPHPDDAEPTARSIAALLNSPLTSAAELADAVAWCYDDAALPLLLPLARHTDAAVRRAVAQALPSVLGETAPDDTVHALIRLSADPDDDVRDWACFALGTQLSEVDTKSIRDTLAARLEDPHDDTRCEALLGLARRRDTRVLPVLHERLARDNVYSLEIDAAGALGHASLHTLVRGHLSGWDDDVVPRVCAALRLTDPDGVGDDLIDGLADWFRAGAPHATDEDRYWWSVTLQLLEHAEYRAPEIAELVHYRLQSAEPATSLMLASRLSQLAGDHGWPRWRPTG